MAGQPGFALVASSILIGSIFISIKLEDLKKKYSRGFTVDIATFDIGRRRDR